MVKTASSEIQILPLMREYSKPSSFRIWLDNERSLPKNLTLPNNLSEFLANLYFENICIDKTSSDTAYFVGLD